MVKKLRSFEELKKCVEVEIDKDALVASKQLNIAKLLAEKFIAARDRLAIEAEKLAYSNGTLSRSTTNEQRLTKDLQEGTEDEGMAMRRFSPLSKYKNVKQNGFHSKREAKRYTDLCFLKGAGEIVSEIEKQKRFDLVVNGKKVCAYYADFVYTRKDGKVVIDDAKGYQTDVFRLKWKLLQAIHGDAFVYVLS